MLGPSLLIVVAALAFQAAESPPAAPNSVIAGADLDLLELERETQAIRDEVRRQLADAAVVPEQAVGRAKLAWDHAIHSKEAAEQALLHDSK